MLRMKHLVIRAAIVRVRCASQKCPTPSSLQFLHPLHGFLTHPHVIPVAVPRVCATCAGPGHVRTHPHAHPPALRRVVTGKLSSSGIFLVTHSLCTRAWPRLCVVYVHTSVVRPGDRTLMWNVLVFHIAVIERGAGLRQHMNNDNRSRLRVVRNLHRK